MQTQAQTKGGSDLTRMAPLIVLIVVALLARTAGALRIAPWRDAPSAVRLALAVMFLFTAAAHFNSMRPDLIAMVPPWMPWPAFMVSFTGVCEILGAAGLLIPRTRRLAAVALILLLIAMLPANVHAANAGLTLRGAPVTPLVPRIALQALFIALLWWSAAPGRSRKPSRQ
jgi:uncharacterized membrane protein